KDFKDAELKFVPAGNTLYRQPPDSDPDIIHVDTGLGRFDHHQAAFPTCAAKLVFESLGMEDEALRRLVNVVYEIDFLAKDLTYPAADDDYFCFLFNERQIIKGWRTVARGRHEDQVLWGMVILDGIHAMMKEKVEAEKVLAEQSVKFQSRWGVGVGARTGNTVFINLAQMKGYKIVVAKDPKKGHVRINALPGKNVDLTCLWEKFSKLDPSATWFLHPQKTLLLNGSTTNPEMKPTKLSLEEVIEVIAKT
ncbi:MAG: hypothetical protein Q8N98_03590, partial [bacterium]|nr:hypothetical protein [bacterium]